MQDLTTVKSSHVNVIYYIVGNDLFPEDYCLHLSLIAAKYFILFDTITAVNVFLIPLSEVCY